MDDKYIDTLCKLIEIPSVFSSHKVEGGPFGKGIKQALEEVLDFGKKLGFNIKNFDGYAGEMTLGTGAYIVGALCHIDVVAPGEGWSTNPFKAIIKNDRIYGRGSSDDKGPMIAVMSAMKRIYDDGKLPEDVSFRIIIGTDEEESWRGINYYVNHAEKLPAISIVPDAAFPVVYCEKGLYDFNVSYKIKEKNLGAISLLELEGGNGRNITAAHCKVILSNVNSELCEKILGHIKMQKYNGKVEIHDDKVTVIINGKAVHAMMPEKGINAISQMIETLDSCLDQNFSYKSFTRDYMKVIGLGYNGREGGFQCKDEQSGKLTFNVGVIKLKEDGTIEVENNVRYPASLEFDLVRKKIKESFIGNGFEIFNIDHLQSVHFEPQGTVVETLLQTYQKVTKDYESKPIAMGGATYARAITNAVSYGMLFPEEEELAHEANEYIALDSLHRGEEIYYQGLIALIEKRGNRC